MIDIVRLFLRAGGVGRNTRTADAITQAEQHEYQRAFRLDHDEQALIVSRIEKYLTVLTNKAVCISTGDTRRRIAYEAISSVGYNLGMQNNINKIYGKSFRVVAVMDQQGLEHAIVVEAGQPYAGIVKVLSHIASRR